jgi:hypothetical protein
MLLKGNIKKEELEAFENGLSKLQENLKSKEFCQKIKQGYFIIIII